MFIHCQLSAGNWILLNSRFIREIRNSSEEDKKLSKTSYEGDLVRIYMQDHDWFLVRASMDEFFNALASGGNTTAIGGKYGD